MNVRLKGILPRYPSGTLALILVLGAGGVAVGLVSAVPTLADPLATAAAVVGAAWPVATWRLKKSPNGGEVRDE